MQTCYGRAVVLKVNFSNYLQEHDVDLNISLFHGTAHPSG